MRRLVLDGSYGEGGGQILRTALSTAAIAHQPIRIERIRAGRPNPGLAAQHLTAVHAVAALCHARLEGATLGSRELEFTPREPVHAGHFEVDVARMREGGSAGSVTLVLQAMLVPLALAQGHSTIDLRGGTHAAHSPPFEMIEDAWLPLLRKMGASADLEMLVRGWYPVGQGHVRATIEGGSLAPLRCEERGELQRVTGRAVTSRLPSHIGERMVSHARAALAAAGVASELVAVDAPAACAGAGFFLTAAYANTSASFGALGQRGKPAELVADEAVSELLAFHASGATLDVHLADQALLPAALAGGESVFVAERASGHLRTNAWVIERFGLARVEIAASDTAPGSVRVTPMHLHHQTYGNE